MRKNLFLSLLIIATFVLAACQPATTTAPTSSPAEVTEIATTEPTSAAATDESSDTATILIKDVQGREVRVPVNPQRIVALSEQDMDAALTLGMPLVGVVNGRGSSAPPVYLQEKLKGVASVGSFTEPSMEQILLLKPDLILIGGVFPGTAGLIEPLSKIAPTVVTYTLEEPWNTAFIKSAAAMNKESAAQAWLKDVYGARITEVKTKLKDQAESSVSIVRFNPDGPVIMARDSFSSLVARDLGLVRPESQQIEGYSHSETISQEQLNMIDGDFLFVASLNPDGAALLKSSLTDPLYQKVNAIKNNKVASVDGAIWTSRGGPLAAMEVLNDIEKYISPSTAQSGKLVITHTRGQVTLEKPAVRVIALEWTYVEDLLVLGIQPVGVSDIEGYNTWVKIPLALSKDAVDLGTRGEPNLETIASLKPDLIIGVEYSMAQNYDKLNAIAPTLVFNPYPSDKKISQYDEMQNTLREIAKATGRSSEAETALQQMQEKFAASRAEIEKAGLKDQKFILSQIYSWENAVTARLFTENGMATQIVEQIGLQNGWDGGFEQYGFTEVSFEKLKDVGDVHFFYVVGKTDNVLELEQVSAVWKSLPFVKANHAYPLGGDTWLFGGPLSAELVAEIIVNTLTKK